ncbi:MAG: GNAT family N-acetyltransferase [Anaerolineales bacterium]|nr:GNAT family N-acetyltransferase [Anaerolineales bacterium]
MEVQSLGYRTDLIFPEFDGQIIDRGDYLVILTPSNPTFYWGNFLLFPNPPDRDDLNNWKTIFTREIKSQLNAEHWAFGWDTVEGQLGEVQPFLDEGFNLNQSVVLAAQRVKIPPKYNQEVLVRPITEDWEWEKAIQNQVACRQAGHSLESFQVFKRDQMARYRQMTRAGLGSWFGAFLEKQLVAELGVFATGEVGRFQQVGTHPDFRRRGICGALVYQASCHAFEHMGVDTLVMVADENYHAAKIYETIGFMPKERQVGVDWWNKAKG